jgi:hypothetical protein
MSPPTGKRGTRKNANRCPCNSCISSKVGGGLKRLKVALCLFGQPRRYKEGYDIFMEWLKAPYHSNIEFDVFFHTWSLSPNDTISSYYRELEDEDKIIPEGIVDKLKQLYRPVASAEDMPITFDSAMYENSLLYNRTNEWGRENINNTLSQQYSRQRVRNLFYGYTKNTGVKYDFVIGSRFDFIVPLSVNLNELNPTMVHLTNCRFPRKHLPDPLIIMNQKVFIKLFNVFDNLPNLINNEKLAQHFAKKCKELYIFHPEEILHMNYIYYYHDNSAFEYHEGIPNFHQ